MAESGTIAVTVVLAERSHQPVVELQVPPGTTVAGAGERSGLLKGRTDLAVGRLGYAIHGRAVPPDRVLEAGDRVEILRPLAADPRDRRRARARAGRPIGRSGRSG